VSERAWLLAICLAELGTMLVVQRPSTRAPALGASPDSRRFWAFGVLGLVTLAGPLAVGFKEFSPRKPVV
jgi:hypothetical protein